jgi:hypothetical protein
MTIRTVTIVLATDGAGNGTLYYAHEGMALPETISILQNTLACANEDLKRETEAANDHPTT